MNQDYSPQIPDLTPASMKNEGVLRRLVNHLRSLTLFAGEGIKISRQGYGTTISVDTVASGGASGGGGEAPYTGEFAISVTGTNELTIAAGDVVSGYTRTAFDGGTLTPTGTFAIYYIYIKVTWVDPDYIIELVGSATKPTQSAGIYYKQIGTADVNSSVVSNPVQTHKGELEVSGRYAT